MNTSPYCGDTENQVTAGNQRYKCKLCERRYTPEPAQMFSDQMRQQALKFYANGLGYRRIIRQLGVDPVTIMNCVKAHVDQLPDALCLLKTPYTW